MPDLLAMCWRGAGFQKGPMVQTDMFGYVAPVKEDKKGKKAKAAVVLTGKLEWKFTKSKGFVFKGKKAQATLAL